MDLYIMGIAALIKVIFDNNKYDLESITPLLHIPKTICWFHCCIITEVTAKA